MPGRVMKILIRSLSAAVFVFLMVVAPFCGDDDDTGSGWPCEDAEEVMQDSPDGGAEIPTGIEHCSDDSWHRYAALECTAPPPDANWCDYDDCEVLWGGCPPNQVCVDAHFDTCECVTWCTSDADCAAYEACVCRMPGNTPARCLPADCRTDADCGGFECGIVRTFGDGGTVHVDGLSCRGADDECHGDDQCPYNICSSGACVAWEGED